MSATTVGVSFKVDKTLRQQFNSICEKEGYPASLVHRKLMEQYIKSKKSVAVSENIPDAKMTEDEFYTRIDKALEIPQEQWIKYDDKLKQELFSDVL